MKDTIDMAREAGFIIDESLGVPYALINEKTFVEFNVALERLVELARADEREACAKKTEEFARKWWKIHCDSNIHNSSTFKAHQDFCALQAAIRARGQA